MFNYDDAKQTLLEVISELEPQGFRFTDDKCMGCVEYFLFVKELVDVDEFDIACESLLAAVFGYKLILTNEMTRKLDALSLHCEVNFPPFSEKTK